MPASRAGAEAPGRADVDYEARVISFPVRSSVLSPAALAARVLPGYSLLLPLECRLISRGVNDVYRVGARDCTWYLRVSPHGWRSVAAEGAEIAFIDGLHRKGVRVTPAMPRARGGQITAIPAPEGERLAVLFASAGDTEIRDFDLLQSRAYGHLAAALHTAADAAATDYRRFHIDTGHLLDEPLAAIRAALPAGADLTFLEIVADRVRRHLADLPRIAPDYGLCHGDLHPGNIRYDADGQPVLFDFDLSGYGWRAYYLTVFHWNAFGERRSKRWRDCRWQSFLLSIRRSGRFRTHSPRRFRFFWPRARSF